MRSNYVCTLFVSLKQSILCTFLRTDHPYSILCHWLVDNWFIFKIYISCQRCHTSLQHPFYWRVIFWIYLGILSFATDRTCIHLLFYLHLQSFLTIFHLSIYSSIKTFIPLGKSRGIHHWRYPHPSTHDSINSHRKKDDAMPICKSTAVQGHTATTVPINQPHDYSQMSSNPQNR